MREKKSDYQNKYCSNSGGQRSARTALFIDQRLRRAAAHRKATTEPGNEIRCRKRQIFLISVESSAMLGGKHSANCSRLDCAEKKASKGKRKQIIQIVPMNRRQFERRNSLRDDADQFHAVGLQ